jgi:OmpA-OmpF porin, OOP family
MSKLLPTLSGVACFLWVSGWTWIFSEGKHTETTGSNHTPINIYIDSTQYLVQHPFSFEFSEATPIIAEELLPAIKTIAQRIQTDPAFKLKIVGIFSPLELNQTSFPNLGQARAESIKTLLVSSGGDPEFIETNGMQADNLFEVDGKLSGVIYFNFDNETPDNQTVVNEKPTAREEDRPDGVTSFFYKYGDYKVEKQHLAVLRELRKQLQNEPDKAVIITGYSAPEEEAASARINLAEMRALSVRRYLVDHGVRRSQIQVNAKPSMAKGSNEMTVTIQVVEK